MRRALVLLALLCTSTNAPAQSPGAPAISGRVLAVGTEVPLRRARIDVSSGSWRAQPVLTDDGGQFSVEAGGLGPLIVTTSKGGYVTARVTVLRENLNRPLELHLPRGAAISGVVTDLKGALVQGYRVTVRRVNADPDRDGSPPEFTGVTDDLGEYRVGGLSRGTYNVFAGSPSQVLDRTNCRNNEPITTCGQMREAGLGASVQVRVDTGDERGGVQLTAPAMTGAEAALAAAQERQPPPTNVALRPGIAASLRGQVLTAARTPVAGATVRVTGSSTFSARTDVNGAFTVSGLPAGQFMVETNVIGPFTVSSLPSGQITVETNVMTWRHGQERPGQAGRPVTITANQVIEGIDIVFPPLRTIRGVVMDEHGEPVQGASVLPMQVRYEGGRLVAAQAGMERRTDDRGSYRLWGLYDGTYLVKAWIDGVLMGRTNRNNTYATLFYPGSPTIAAAQRIDLREEAVADIIFAPVTLTEVTGVALDGDGKLVAGTARLIEARQQGLVSETRTGAIKPDGTFTVQHVPPGNYVLQVLGDGPGRTGLFATLPVSVGDTPVHVTVKPSYGTSVEGRVVIEGAESRGFQVVPVPLDDRARTEPRIVMIGSTEFFVTGLFGPTAFTLRGGSMASVGDWYLKSFTINGTDISDSGFDFGAQPDTITDAVLVLSRNGASISGQLRTSTSRDYFVVAFPTSRETRFALSRRMKFARAAADGTFRIQGLPPGEYFVAAVDRLDGTADGGEWQNPEFLLRFESGAERVSLAEGQTRSVSLGLIER